MHPSIPSTRIAAPRIPPFVVSSFGFRLLPPSLAVGSRLAMAGIMSPIAGESKKRTCYFFDSGASPRAPRVADRAQISGIIVCSTVRTGRRADLAQTTGLRIR